MNRSLARIPWRMPLFGIACIFLSSCALFRATADSVMDDGEDAIASDFRASRVKSAEFVYEYENKKDAKVVVRTQKPGQIRMDVLDGANTVVICLNGIKDGWVYSMGEITDMDAETIADVHLSLLQALPYSVDLQQLITDAILLPEKEFAAGEQCHVVEGKLQRNPETSVKLWFGEDSDLLRQIENTDKKGTHQIQFFDYRSYDGISLASTLYNFTPDGIIKLKLAYFEENPDFSDSVFTRPEVISIPEGD